MLERVTVQFVQGLPQLAGLLRLGRLDAAAPPSTVNLAEVAPDDVEVERRLGWERIWLDFRGSTLTPGERLAVGSRLNRGAIERTFVRGDGRIADTLAPSPGRDGATGPWDGLLSPPLSRQPIQLAAPLGDDLLGLIQRAAYTQLSAAGADVELATIEPEVFYGAWKGPAGTNAELRRSAGGPPFAAPSEAVRRVDAYPLFQVASFTVSRPGVNGVSPNPTYEGPLWNMQRWWVGEPD